MNFNKTSGIYIIFNNLNGKLYIGSAINLDKRIKQHIKELNNNHHDNDHLQKAWNLYQSNNFIFGILSFCPKDKLIEKEQWFIDFFGMENLYNIAPIAGSTLGIKLIFSDEHKQKISLALKNKPKSKDAKIAMSIAASKRIRSPHKLETKKKISEAHRGKIHGPMSNEHKLKISLANSGKSLSDNHKKKIGAASKNRKHDNDIKDKMSVNRSKNIYSFLYKEDGTQEQISQIKYFVEKYGLNRSSVNALIGGRLKSYKGWILIDRQTKI